MRRSLTVAILGIALLFCVAIVVVYVSIGSVIKTAVETYGSAITQVTVTLQEADFSSASGETTLLNLAVANPANFISEISFLFPNIDIQIDPQTVGSDVMVIKRLEIEAPEIIYEITNTGDNLRTIRANVKKAVAEERQGRFLPDAPGVTKKFIINDLYVTNGVVIVHAKNLAGKKVTALLDTIHLEDLGRAENGLGPAELVDKIYGPIIQETTLAALSTDLNLSDQALNILRGASDETEEVLNRIRKLLEK
ncbi:MAG: hypothetical protein K9G33_11335 [Sneathiella sp.]|nr:hypothetical protein [Sneathiella sp.]